MTHQTLQGTFSSSQPFEFRASRPARLSEVKERSCKQAEEIFGCKVKHLGTSSCKELGSSSGKKRKTEAGEDPWVSKDEVQQVGPAGPTVPLFPVLKVLAEEKLEQYAERVQTRMLKREEKPIEKTDDPFREPVLQRANGFEKLLHISGLKDTMSIDQLIDAGNNAHISRNCKLHSNDAKLIKDGKKLVKQGFTKMLKEDCPYECAIIEHVEWILANLC